MQNQKTTLFHKHAGIFFIQALKYRHKNSHDEFIRPGDVATVQWRHSQIKILSSVVISLVRKRRQQTMTFW